VRCVNVFAFLGKGNTAATPSPLWGEGWDEGFLKNHNSSKNQGLLLQ
jgi:hypothetical protein